MTSLAVGMGVGTGPPLSQIGVRVRAARLMRLDSVFVVDHFMSFIPQELWDRDLSWSARPRTSPHRYFDYQTLTGHLASKVGSMRLGVGVTEPIRRHPVLIAQAFMTLAHLSRERPILGIGAGERENTEPYGFDFSTPVGVLDEALQIIRLCFGSNGPIQFTGKHFTLDRALMDLSPPPEKTPEIWVAAHGPRMLQLTGRYGDGWYPTEMMNAETYASKLAVVRSSAAAAGRDPDEIVPAMQAFMLVAKTRSEADTMLSSRGMRLYALITAPAERWKEHGVDHPFGPAFRGIVDFVPTRYSKREVEAAMAKVPSELLPEIVLRGTPEDITEALGHLSDAGLRHVVAAPLSAMFSPKDALFSTRAVGAIAKAFRD